jgi:hypothetical protein
VEHISQRFLEFTTEYVFERFLDHPPSEEEAAEAAGLIRRLRPLAQQTVDAELARAMRLRATEHIRRHLGEAAAAPAPRASVTTTEAATATVTERATATVTVASPPATPPPTADVPLPEPTVRAVRELVGAGQVAAFVAAAAEREVAARRMDALTAAARRNAAAATATDPDPDGNGPSHLGNSGA